MTDAKKEAEEVSFLMEEFDDDDDFDEDMLKVCLTGIMMIPY